jgi:hypothetical protein
MSFNYKKAAKQWLIGELGEETSDDRRLVRLAELVKGMPIVREIDKAKKKKALDILEEIRCEYNKLTEQKAMLEEQIEILEER